MSCDEFSLTYGELEVAVGRYAGALTAAGAGPADVVAVLGTSRPECFITFLAACRIGALFLGLDPKHTARELACMTQDARPRLLVGISGPAGPDEDDKLREVAAATDSVRAVVMRAGRRPSGSLRLDELTRQAPGRGQSVARAASPDDACAIVYTSGSTGEPKGALLSQRGILRSCRLTWRHWYGAIPNLRTVAQHPIDHVGWLVCECATTLVAGGSLHFREHFDGAQTLRLIERERLNLWLAFPSMVMLAAGAPEFESCDLSSLRRLAFGSIPSIDLLLRLRQRTDAAFAVSYGTTEASGGALTVTRDGADLAELSSSLGTPLPGVQWRIRGPDGTLAPPGLAGELLVRDESLFLGYLNRPEATREAFDPQGWLRTGDVVEAQPDGSLRMVGRLKEMFKSGGYNIYPTEVETAIASHDGVAAVAVVEAPDPLWGEVGVAFVQARPGGRLEPEQLRGHARSRLANYKVPKRFVVVDRLPLLVNGKPDKGLLRMQARRPR